MLLSSSRPCDGRAKPPGRLSSLPTFDECAPPHLQPLPTPRTGTTLYTTCRALQAMLMNPSTPPPSAPGPYVQKPALQSPIAFRPRRSPEAHRRAAGPTAPPTFKIRKTKPHQAPRGVNKRRRSLEDDENDDEPTPSDGAASAHSTREGTPDSNPTLSSDFTTPKRARLLAPPDLPLGLSRSDFAALSPARHHHHTLPRTTANPIRRHDPDDWTTEDDRALVQLVIEKFKLSHDDWVECAKTLGKDKASVGRRWKALVGDGSVGIRGNGPVKRGRKPRAGLDMRSTL
ncbi:MAG: hypothetical protein M4579_006894 [Chaenotheca gracillima]|nr:MAG: hypothetical protein M4579_006894 [Chaenotheca gracillima]